LSRVFSTKNSNIDQTTVPFRPVGQKELDLIRQSGFTEFPPRLPEQPIFYPVLYEEYAAQIARDWNAKHGQPNVGYVTRFHTGPNTYSDIKSKPLVVRCTRSIGYQRKSWLSLIRILSEQLRL
jgi:hypothetical protein